MLLSREKPTVMAFTYFVMSEPFALKNPTIQVEGFNNTDAHPEWIRSFSFNSGDIGSKRSRLRTES